MSESRENPEDEQFLSERSEFIASGFPSANERTPGRSGFLGCVSLVNFFCTSKESDMNISGYENNSLKSVTEVYLTINSFGCFYWAIVPN